MTKKGFQKLAVIILSVVMSFGVVPVVGVFSNGKIGQTEAKAAVGDVDPISASLERGVVTSEIPLDNDALFADYTEVQLAIASAPETSSARGTKLTGIDRLVYLALKDDIESVADGRSTSSVFEVTTKELGVENKTWTAKELGVTAIIKDGDISEEAMEAISQKLDYDLDKVNYALLSDFPYELYWYDKVCGVTAENILR